LKQRKNKSTPSQRVVGQVTSHVTKGNHTTSKVIPQTMLWIITKEGASHTVKKNRRERGTHLFGMTFCGDQRGKTCHSRKPKTKGPDRTKMAKKNDACSLTGFTQANKKGKREKADPQKKKLRKKVLSGKTRS